MCRSHTLVSILVFLFLGTSDGFVAPTSAGNSYSVYKHQEHVSYSTRQPWRQRRLGQAGHEQFRGSGVLRMTKDSGGASIHSSSLVPLVLLSTISFFYWYYMILGAAAQSLDLPLIPDWLPMTPGWPPSDADLAPAVQDSLHFFYLSDVLGASNDCTAVLAADQAPPPTLRLALFNVAEAWIFCFLPLLWSDGRRLPRPVVLATWIGALGLTNAFLAPYLFISEIFKPSQQTTYEKNRIVSAAIGAIAVLVVGYGVVRVVTQSSVQDWDDFGNLVATDRTYLAFCLDLVLFSVFQPFLIQRVKKELTTVDKIPFVGLVVWLFQP